MENLFEIVRWVNVVLSLYALIMAYVVRESLTLIPLQMRLPVIGLGSLLLGTLHGSLESLFRGIPAGPRVLMLTIGLATASAGFHQLWKNPPRGKP